MGTRRSLFVAGALAALVATASPAFADQTGTFGMAPVGESTSLYVDPGHGPVTQQLEVYNRSPKPITLALQVDAVIPQPGNQYAIANQTSGFADNVHLPATTIQLAGHQHKILAVTIDRPESSSTRQYAAITAEQVQKLHAGLNIRGRIGVYVELRQGPVALTSGSGDTGKVIAISIAGALVVLLAIAVALITRRRRRPA